jgi:hypothetical protein
LKTNPQKALTVSALPDGTLQIDATGDATFSTVVDADSLLTFFLKIGANRNLAAHCALDYCSGNGSPKTYLFNGPPYSSHHLGLEP